MCEAYSFEQFMEQQKLSASNLDARETEQAYDAYISFCQEKGCLLVPEDRLLEYLWQNLGDIPVDDDGDEEPCLAEDFLFFKAGTSQMEVWHWFDDNHSTGVHSLMFPSAEQD